MNLRAPATLALTALLCASMGLFIAARLEVTTGLDHFLSDASEVDLAVISSRMMDSPTTRSMVLFVRGPDLPAALDATRIWRETLAQHPEVETVRLGPDPALADVVTDLYFPRRYFFSRDAKAATADLASPAGLRTAAHRLRDELSSPRAGFIKEIAADDPLLAFPDLLDRFREQVQGRLKIVNGQFAVPEENAGVILLTTRHSAFASSFQNALEDFILQSFTALQADSSAALELKRSGIHRFAVTSERRGISESQQISTISMLAIAAIFMVFFRSPTLLVAAVLPLGTGILVATTVSILIFDQLHLMTVVFGSTLIGICIDYPIHYICHQTLMPARDGPMSSMRRVWPAISMGAFTTVAGFGGLAWSDFPGIRELGVFAMVGILGALLATRAILPSLIPATPSPNSVRRRAAMSLARGLEGLRLHRVGLRIGFAVALVLVCAVLPFVTWNDDVFSLNIPIDKTWAEEDHEVRQWLSQMDMGRFVVAIGDDDEQGIERNDAVYDRIVAARDRGLLEDFRSLHVFLPSVQAQERNFADLRDTPDLATRYLDTLEAVGFRRDAFRGFEETLQSEPPAALRFSDFTGTPLADLVGPFRVELEDRVAFLTFLKGVGDGEAIKEAIAGLPGVYYFDQQSFIGELYGRYRARVMLLVASGLVAVALLLFVRFRSLRDTIATLAPAVAAAATTLAILCLTGSSINLLHLLGLLLVLSIGVDYAIFLVSTHRSGEGQEATLLSLCIACASTCVSFGMLSLSDFPALHALGVTTGLGTLLSLLFAPSVFALLKDDGDAA